VSALRGEADIPELRSDDANPDIPADKDSAPQALVESIDMDQVKKEYGVLGASMNALDSRLV
jgi:hypothetical protein